MSDYYDAEMMAAGDYEERMSAQVEAKMTTPTGTTTTEDQLTIIDAYSNTVEVSSVGHRTRLVVRAYEHERGYITHLSPGQCKQLAARLDPSRAADRAGTEDMYAELWKRAKDVIDSVAWMADRDTKYRPVDANCLMSLDIYLDEHPADERGAAS